MQKGYVRLHLAVPKPLADRFKDRCDQRSPRGMKKLGAAAISILNGLSDDVVDALADWAVLCENMPERAIPDGAARVLADHLIEAAEYVEKHGDGEPRFYIDRIIDPQIMKRNGSRKNAG